MRISGSRRVALDTSAYSHLRARHEGVAARIAAAEMVYVPVVVLGELEAAFRSGTRERENLAILASFLAEPFVSVLDVTPEVARRYGQLFAQLRSAGTPLPVNDIWIAATCFDSGAQLLTFDGDFERIPSLDVELFQVGR